MGNRGKQLAWLLSVFVVPLPTPLNLETTMFASGMQEVFRTERPDAATVQELPHSKNC